MQVVVEISFNYLAEPTITSSFEGASKNVFLKAAANVGSLSIDATLKQEIFHLASSRSGRCHGQHLAIEEFMTVQSEFRNERTHLFGLCWRVETREGCT